MPGSDPSVLEHVLALAAGLLALLLRSVILAGEAGLSAVGAERATEISQQSRAGRAVAKLKADAEGSAGGIRAALALCFAVAVVAAGREAIALHHTVLADVPTLVLALVGGGIAWAVTILADTIPRSLAAAAPEAWAV